MGPRSQPLPVSLTPGSDRQGPSPESPPQAEPSPGECSAPSEKVSETEATAPAEGCQEVTRREADADENSIHA